MNDRIFSWVVYRVTTPVVVATAMTILSADANAQSGYYTDPGTGIVYQKVTRTIDKPIVETKIEHREQTVYRPQTVTETKPQSRTVFTPVIEYKWEPRMHGRWNPFRPPSIHYTHVPHTSWEARNEVVHRTNTRTEWVAERRTIEVPQRLVRMTREKSVDYEPVGRVSSPAPSVSSSDIASRLRPLDNGATFQSFNSTSLASTSFGPPRIAASTVGTMSGDPPRNPTQSGMAPHTLSPAPPGLPTSSGIANARPLPTFR
ncbi:MAG: hypothetical protein ACR2NZ_07250 [Rubripirellula sp.]